MADEAAPTRTERKRTAILDTATTLFLTNGFRGTTMDEIAAKAEVSKQTVYKQFEDKELLFRSIVDRITSNAGAIVDAINTAFGPEEITRAELRDRLIAVGRVYVDGVLDPRVRSLRRLIIAEADRFPDLAAQYYELGPGQGIATMATHIDACTRAGILEAEDSMTAAQHFAYLVVGAPIDHALFHPTTVWSRSDRDEHVNRAVDAFLSGYATDS
jgi:TetR/AcrR family transcriptional repressor of mexJK operon